VVISDDEARELAGLLAGDEAGQGLGDRIGRALAYGSGVIATDRLEARAVLFAVQRMLAGREHSPRLLELRASLVQVIDRAP
jgi:hypothetical protein